jgi:hypothetical protein
MEDEATGNGVRASFKTANKVGSVKSENEVNLLTNSL